MQQQLKKRTRTSHPKVRTGCHTCKIRRVKCDEQRPACQKCLSTGRKCEGYKNNREWIVVVAPPAPVTDGFEDDRSRRHFDYFRAQAVYQISWFFEGGQWGALVLQESHSSAAIRHAVIALACSHEDFRDNMTVAAKAPQYAYAAQHYSKAIRNLIKEMSDDAQQSRMRALVCGLLFISIETLRGNTVAAMHHLEGCLKIVREAQEKMESSYNPLERWRPEPEEHLSEDIIPMFARLDVHTNMTIGRIPLGTRLDPIAWDPSIHILIEEPPLLGFQSVVQACNAQLCIANRVHIFMQSYSDRYRRKLVRHIPYEVLDEKLHLIDQLKQWDHAVLSLLGSAQNHHVIEKVLLLQIHQRTGMTLLESSLHVEECLLDNYQWAFEDIVNFATEIKQRPYGKDDDSSNDSDSSMTDEPSHQPSPCPTRNTPAGSVKPKPRCFFLLDHGIVFALYWTALKARDSLLRRRAVEILEYSAQEGVWIGPIQAAIAKRVIEIEEDQPYEHHPPPERIKTPTDVPEFMRVHSVEPDIDKMNRRAKLIISQRPYRDEGDWSERVEWVSW